MKNYSELYTCFASPIFKGFKTTGRAKFSSLTTLAVVRRMLAFGFGHMLIRPLLLTESLTKPKPDKIDKW